ncbi:MAG: tryptophan--tRNA ligase [Chloroflexi bacterium RBG_19FT_COMBO_48_23]|nr:MAG: tryptophan--tRNA ligase [Chloroflexi bacterium RBG_19FT_COMBO_48_23]
MKKRVFSGARPTGRQHIGNYIGAIQNYVALQKDYDCIYCIVDIHALTTLEDTDRLQQDIHEMTLDWLAAGLDPQKSILFVQSHVPEVMELYTLLGMVTPLGWLMRVPTFKEKARMQPQNVNYGLVGYPVLMTADIVLYKAEVVPVGEDQLPHLELAREIARRFNSLFGNTFPEPQAKLTSFPMVLGLNGAQKMGKSYNNYVELAATPEETSKLVMTAVTDPARKYRADPGHPDVCNVFSLHGFFNPDRVDGIAVECRSAEIGCVDCKKLLAEGINSKLSAFRETRASFAAKPQYVAEVLADGAKRAQAIALKTLTEVKEKMGLLPRDV